MCGTEGRERKKDLICSRLMCVACEGRGFNTVCGI